MFDQITEIPNLYAAWRKVRANGGAGGIDAVSLKSFEKNLQENLTELSRNLQCRTYQPLPVKFVRVMKANGKLRELGILTVRDRVAQRAVLDALEPQIESLMQDCNFAFRQGRNVEMAIQQMIAARANGFWWTVEADIENFFPSINRELLLKDVGGITTDENILHLIDLWLNAGMLEETWWQTGGRKINEVNSLLYEAATEGFENLTAQRLNYAADEDDFAADFEETPLSPFDEEKAEKRKKREAVKTLLKEGFWLAMAHRAVLGKVIGVKTLGIGGLALAGAALTPKIIEAYRQRFHPRKGILQGSPLSPVLANLHLTEFDKRFMRSDCKLIRYCDDFVILCRTETEAAAALETARRELAAKNLVLHQEKTRILAPADEFEFLGYRFLADGTVEPPPSATRETVEKIKRLSGKAKNKMKETAFKVKKVKVKTWKEFFRLFGKRD